MRQMIVAIAAFGSVYCSADVKVDKASPTPPKSQVLPKQREGEMEIAIERKSPSIQAKKLTKELAKQYRLEHGLKFDPGFSKYLLVFNEIPGKSPYSIQIKRFAHLKSSQFKRMASAEEDAKIERSKVANQPYFCLFSARGFVPGEQVAIRIISSDRQFKEIAFYPRPLFLRKPTGEILMKATLTSPLYPTNYTCLFCGIPEEEEFQMLSQSGDESGNFDLKGPITVSYSPDIISAKGGFSHLQVKLKDGSTYKMELPWGSELTECFAGNQ